MSRITVGATVECTDGHAGELVALVIDPAKKTVTHYVVRSSTDKVERMVLADQVGASTPQTLNLKCTRADLDAAPPFVRADVLAEHLPDPNEGNFMPNYYYGYGIPDIVSPDLTYVTVREDQVPAGELGLREGAEVHATDGHVGSVRSLVLDDTGTITHFGLEQGHRSHTELTLPLGAVDYVDDKGVHLKLSKAAVHGLPALPVAGGRHMGLGYERIELVGKVFQDTTGAQKALEYLQQQAHEPAQPLKIREAAVLVREEGGKTRIVQSSQPSAVKGAVVGAAAGGLLALLGPLGVIGGAVIGGGLGAAAGPKIDMGFPDAFLKRLEERLKPGHSALVVLVEHDYAHDLAEALQASDDVVGGQQIVDTLVQEMLVENKA